MDQEQGILAKTGILLNEEDGKYLNNNTAKMTEIINSIGTKAAATQANKQVDSDYSF